MDAEATAKGFMRKDKSLLSVELCFLLPRECFEAALASGINIIVILPRNDIRMTPALKKAVQ
jgi:hypothetical protein